MQPFDLCWACLVGGQLRTGALVIWAPDAETAIDTVRANAASFGLTEHPMVSLRTGRIGGRVERRRAA